MFDSNFFYVNKVNKKEEERLKKQKSCSHQHYVTRCSLCQKILGSEVQKNIDLEEDVVNDKYRHSYETVHYQKNSYALSYIYLNKEQESEEEITSYTFTDFSILKGQAKILLSEPFKEIDKQVILSAGQTMRLKKNQKYRIIAVKNGVALSINKINI